MIALYVELTLYWFLCWCIYHMCFSKLSFCSLNRFVLIAFIFCPVLIQWIPQDWLMTSTSGFHEFKIQWHEMVVLPEQSFAPGLSANFIYLAMVCIAGLFWFRSFLQLRGITRQAVRKSGDSGIVYYLPGNTIPFAFLNRIYLPLNLKDSPDVVCIIRHEQEHISRMHYIDLLALSCLRIIFPFNPMLWLLGRSLRMVHEYETDQRMKKFVEPDKYARLLVRTAEKFTPVNAQLAHAFFSITIKSRIMMLFSKSSKIQTLRYLMLPLALGLVLFLHAQSTAVLEKIPYSVDSGTDTESAMDADSGSQSTKIIESDGPNYLKAEKEPSFPGGVSELIKFISKHLKYPEAARKKGIETTCYVELKIHQDGRAEIKNLKGNQHEHFTACIEEIVGQMPKWIPGQADGKNVTSTVTLPIKFKLDEKNVDR
ncbi:MAG: M56 family metallopeptidase [Saprospiraceae bacterium]|nr:M56 family metallopeptidase [Saprospiraceae bacterium]